MTVMDYPRAPERSLQQRLDALARANEIRTRRKELKADLKARRVSIMDVLADEIPEWLGSMKIAEVLLAVPALGPVKVRVVLTRAGVSPSKALGGMTPRQLMAVWNELHARGVS